jgi:hypothetical protein
MAPGQVVQSLMEDIVLSKEEPADALETTRRRLERHRSGETYPQRDTRRRLAEFVKQDRRLKETFDDRGAIGGLGGGVALPSVIPDFTA